MSIHSRKLLPRYSAAERMNHWMVAITFVLLALSGLALFHPSLFWLTQFFGGGTWTRILHPFVGVVMFISFLALAARFAHHNRMTDADRTWLRQIGDVANKREANLPQAGRYNGGQKAFFWLMAVGIGTLALSGLVFWQPYFAPFFAVEALRVAVVLHAVAAFVVILGLIIHIYAAIWVTGSMRAMLRGTVTVAWARKHHPAWFRQITEGAEK